MIAPNYILEEDLALVTAYINFGGDSVVGVQQKKGKLWGEIIPYFNEKTKNPYNRNQHSLENQLLVIKKEMFLSLARFTKRKVAVDSNARIEYTRIYRKEFPHEEIYKLFKYVKGYDYTKYTDEDEEDIPIAPLPTVELDRKNEEREEEEQELDEEDEVEAGDEVRVSIHPPYKPTPNVEIEKDHPKKRTIGIKHNKALKKAKYTGENSSSSTDSIFSQSSEKSSHISKKKMQQSPLLL
ncbi:hypothetical protein MKW98_019327 [Papaver atlanticum]|uniref:Uncharacterized protein n=1 Tax=Papaver atlanticum TaxID=357466 RepID=A0AAD4S915_9MAGN|nr:hypothetical protein MKW98_019327 [Papaver atlanticum]